jgi:hypothetical protein
MQIEFKSAAHYYGKPTQLFSFGEETETTPS